LKPLESGSGGDIDIARQRIDEMHPIYGTSVDSLMPYVCCFRRLCRNTNVMANEPTDADTQKALDAENDLKEVEERLVKVIKAAGTRVYEGTDPLSDAKRVERDSERSVAVRSDPFNSYGYGIIAYFTMQRLLMATYVLICCGALWIMLQYNTGKALEDVDKNYYMFSRFSLGNLGAAKTACITQNLDTGADAYKVLSCDPGLAISALNEDHLGVVPGNKGKTDYKYRTEGAETAFFGNDYCGEVGRIPDEDNCKKDLFDSEMLKNDF
jgi:hypothetical protein